MAKKMNLIAAAGVMVIALLVMLTVSTAAFAREDEPNDDQKEMEIRSIGVKDGISSMIKGESVQLKVEPNGKFSASGLVVNSNLNPTLNVKFFGINFNVRIDNARVEGTSATTTVSEITAGDKLSITGSIDQVTGVISAERIVDHTLTARRTGDIQSRIADLLRLVEQLRAQLKQIGR